MLEVALLSSTLLSRIGDSNSRRQGAVQASGNCMRDDGFRIINFAFTPPPNVYLYSPPKNQVTFCFSLLLSQPSDISLPDASFPFLKRAAL